MNRCTGHCCRAFSLPFSLEQMKVAYKKALADRANGRPINLDYIKVYPMLIPLADRPGKHPNGPARQGGERYYYTCRHFKNGNCTNYERRPNMCRNYPQYGSDDKLCEYAGCTWDDHHGLRSHRLRVFSGDCEQHTSKLGKMIEDVSAQLKEASHAAAEAG